MSRSSKITLSASRDIPFHKLVLSQANVRKVKAGVSVEELAEDIARRGLLQGLSARAVVDGDGTETGMFEIPAGGRRYRALEHLVKAKRMAKTCPVPCIVRTSGIAEEDSLAENVQRAPLHPLDQFRAFLALREKGTSEEEIAATFFVPVSVVRQRLKLASVSAKLLDAYAEDGMSLDQLMAFTVNGDHARQEQVFDAVSQGYDKQPYTIRRMLTEHAVRASDKRAQFVGIDAYVEAGGGVMRDLFQGDDGGWLDTPALVDMLVAEKLRDEADRIAREGWKWVEAAPDLPYGHHYGLRQLRGNRAEPTDEEAATRASLEAEQAAIEAEWTDSPDDLPEAVDARLGEIETAIAALDERPEVFDPEDMARAGVFVSIDHNGRLQVRRGFVRPEDEAPVAPDPDVGATGESDAETGQTVDTVEFGTAAASDEEDEDDGARPLSDRLIADLTAFRTVALRDALAARPEVAFRVALHAVVLQCFFSYDLDSCLELTLKRVWPGGTGLADSVPARSIEARHEAWGARLPQVATAVWDWLADLDVADAQSLFAHCIAQGLNATIESYNRRPRAIAHADCLARDIALDVAKAGWVPTVDAYLGRVTKARILAAVGEACGPEAAGTLAHLKKGDMATAAAERLAETGWLPDPLRTEGVTSFRTVAAVGEPTGDVAANEEPTSDAEAPADAAVEGDDAEESYGPFAIAAE